MRGRPHLPAAIPRSPVTTLLLHHTAATCLCSQEGVNRLLHLGRATTRPNIIEVSVGEGKGHRAGILPRWEWQVQDLACYSSKYC